MTPENEDYWPCEILNGPSKWNLILALFEGKRVEFELEKMSSNMLDVLPDWWPDAGKVEADITKVEAALPPPSFGHWEIDGFLPKVSGDEAPFIRFKGEFSTQTRKGRFTLYDGKEVN